jgi:hypothetical protein
MLFDKYPGDCSGTDYRTVSCDRQILGNGPGYYLWLLSSVILVTGNIIRIRRKKALHASMKIPDPSGHVPGSLDSTLPDK